MAAPWVETIATSYIGHNEGSCRNRWQFLPSHLEERTHHATQEDPACEFASLKTFKIAMEPSPKEEGAEGRLQAMDSPHCDHSKLHAVLGVPTQRRAVNQECGVPKRHGRAPLNRVEGQDAAISHCDSAGIGGTTDHVDRAQASKLTAGSESPVARGASNLSACESESLTEVCALAGQSAVPVECKSRCVFLANPVRPNESRSCALDAVPDGDSKDKESEDFGGFNVITQDCEESMGLSDQSEILNSQPSGATTPDLEEPSGLTSLVSTLGLWVSQAFEESEVSEGFEGEEKISVECGFDSDPGNTFPACGASPHQQQDQMTNPTSLTTTDFLAASSLSDEPTAAPASLEHRSEDEQPLTSPRSSDSNPQIFIHLWMQPEPILWSPDNPVLQTEEGVVESEDRGEETVEIDSRYLHAPLLSLFAATEGSLEPPVPPQSLRDIAQKIELWLLDSEVQRLGGDRGAEGSVCSSESSDEEAEERFHYFSQLSAYFGGSGRDQQARGDSEEGFDSLLEPTDLVQPVDLNGATTPECSLASSVRIIDEGSVATAKTELQSSFALETPDVYAGPTGSSHAAAVTGVDAPPTIVGDNFEGSGCQKQHITRGNEDETDCAAGSATTVEKGKVTLTFLQLGETSRACEYTMAEGVKGVGQMTRGVEERTSSDKATENISVLGNETSSEAWACSGSPCSQHPLQHRAGECSRSTSTRH